MSAPKIYCFIRSRPDVDWYNVCAIAEDGHVLAEHVSSTPAWALHDIGISSDWKHDKYREHYPNGFELEWVDVLAPEIHAGLKAACDKNRALGSAKASGGAK